MGLFKKTETKSPLIGRKFGKPYISTPVLVLIGFCAFVFLSYRILHLINADFAPVIQQNMLMPTDYAELLQKPWTILTSMFFHDSALAFLANIIGILIFGNLCSMLFSQKMVLPMFVSGGVIASACVWIFKEVPLTSEALQNIRVGGASGGMMTLAMLASFYMPEHIVRLYGVYPLKLKFIGRAMLLFSVVSIFFENDIPLHILQLGGAFGGYIFLVLLKRNKLAASPIPFFGSRKKVWKSAKVEMKVIHNKPLTDDEFNDIQVSKKEYLDHLLDKISRNGVDSLSRSEMDFLNKFGKE